MSFNYVDAVAAIIFVLYLVRGLQVGLWSWIRNFVSLIAGLFAAIFLYKPVGDFLAAHIHSTQFVMTPAIGYTVSFILLMIIVQTIVSILGGILFKRFPNIFKENRVTHAIALIPAALESAIVIGFLVLLSGIIPIPTTYTQVIAASATGTFVNRELPSVEKAIDGVTGNRLSQALALLTVHSENDEHPETLSFKPSSTSIDEAAEQQMLVLVNQERAKVGVGPLTVDPTLTAVARAHSQDMWDRQYFSHVTPDNVDPFDRMHAAGITYMTAGENIALAPTVTTAHVGLMNSPGHRANILNPAFKHVGIGVVDGGIFGKMFTQDFTN